MTDSPDAPPAAAFADLGLSPPLLHALDRLGHATPTAVQAAAIPVLLAGRDLLGQAQTGTGKTGAYALPLLQRLDPTVAAVQALVLVPTRELALQVAEAVVEYGRESGAPSVLAIYGGAPMDRQLRKLAAGVRIVVGTPGRVQDHLTRGSLDLSGVRTVVLDEADEMLRQGFAEEVEQILARAPAQRQMALLSATMPDAIAALARRHLRQPEHVTVAAQARTVDTVAQHYVVVQPHARLEALSRILAVDDAAAVLVFARTRAGCAELSDALNARGVPTEALHGDLAQAARESVVRRLKQGQLRVVIATDVAARGLDVEQIALVVAVDMPGEAEVYVHRIGRTGRAGRQGRSVQFVMPREERRLRDLERYIQCRLEPMQVPTERDVELARTARFSAQVQAALATDLASFRALAAQLTGDPAELLAAVVKLAWGDRPPPWLDPTAAVVPRPTTASLPAEVPASRPVEPAAVRPTVSLAAPSAPPPAARPSVRPPVPARHQETALPEPHEVPALSDLKVWLSLGVGRRNGVQPADVVGVLVQEGRVPEADIGAVDIRDNFTLVEVGARHARTLPVRMRRTLVCGRYLQPRLQDGQEQDANDRSQRRPKRAPRPRPGAGERLPV
jgi:ATP-dependent RNA helicase DeaD